MKIDKQNAHYRAIIEENLEKWLEKYTNEPQKQLYDAMRYSLMGGGKRLRPIFTLEFCRMCCGDWKPAEPFAAAVEMIQTYSLIHDDLPSMDNDDFRRGKPTNHKVYGEAMAILAGDALLTDAFSAVASAELPAKDIALAVSVLADCSGSAGMVGGQVLDILSEERICTEQEVLDIQSRKTAALIKAACVLGVIAGGGSELQICRAGEFAANLGMAFQIRDDILDVIGDANQLGKAVGTDANKNTFVRLYGLEKCEMLVEEYTNAALSALNDFHDNAYMKELALGLTTRNA